MFGASFGRILGSLGFKGLGFGGLGFGAFGLGFPFK